jgi:hypothetical protein
MTIMRVIIGLLLLIVSFIGSIFFSHYTGDLIADPTLWYIAFILLGLFGAWLFFISFKRAEKSVVQHYSERIEKIKAGSEKIELNFDDCEFKSGSFYHYVEDPELDSVRVLTKLGPLTPDTTTIKQEVQSYLIYNYNIDGISKSFISQSFPFDQTTLKFYVLNHNITLYVDKFDENKYLFDLKR